MLTGELVSKLEQLGDHYVDIQRGRNKKNWVCRIWWGIGVEGRGASFDEAVSVALVAYAEERERQDQIMEARQRSRELGQAVFELLKLPGIIRTELPTRGTEVETVIVVYGEKPALQQLGDKYNGYKLLKKEIIRVPRN